MTIRRQLTLLVAAVAVPVIILATVASARLWGMQREAHEQRHLERASALRLALDTEFDGTIRLLGGLGGAENLGLADTPAPDVAERFTQLLRTHPEWTVLGLADADGRPLVSVTRSGDPPLPAPAPALLKSLQVPAVTDLLKLPDGRHATYVVSPVEAREGAVPGWLYVGETSDDWLRFLRRYPISPEAVLTIVDGAGLIVARTQGHAQWVGQPVPQSFMQRAHRTNEGSIETRSMEGQPIYAAYSRSRMAGWLLATGVASGTVEQALRQSTVGLVAGFGVTALVVAALAFGIGSRVIRAMSRLANAAGQVGTPGAELTDDEPLSVREAETVRQALRRASETIQARNAERAAAFEREAEARAAAERLNASKDEFIAMLGHELRNPLSALKSASTLLALPDVPDAVKARSHQIVERQIGRLTALIDDMLDVARLDSGKIVLAEQRLDLSVLVGHVVDAFHSASRCAHVTLDTTLEPVWVDGDETRLEQITANLLDNACKYTPPGGRIWLSTRCVGDLAVLEVRDDGSGIAAELLPRVFDVFAQGQRTLARAEGGLGLGLTVVRRLVALHGGRVTAESDGPGLGATFRLELPAREPAQPASAAAAAPGADASAALRIVVVEDEPENRELYQLLLEEEGHAVVATADGEAGVAAILAERPDVAIVDIGLPGIDGFEVARRVRAADDAHRPLLVAVTGYGTPADRDKAIAAGFDAFLRKPFDLDAFLTLLRERATRT